MVIKGSFYEMKKLNDAPFYDLSVMTKVHEGSEKEREELKIVGYGIPFDSCINRLVDVKLREEVGEYTIPEYLEKYEEIVKLISKDFE